MAKKIITKTITINIEYDYITFDGTNFDEVKEFVDTYKLYGNSNIEESFHKRPEDIPNLDEKELLKWWISTGEEIEDCTGRRFNTHHSNNMPLWRKDELLMIEFKSVHAGYIQREFLCKDVTIIVIGRRYYVVNKTDEEEIIAYIEHLYECAHYC